MSLQRRTLLGGLGGASLAAALALPLGSARAQRVTNPIARPGRVAGAVALGRFRDRGQGVAGGPAPGLFTVVAVDKMNNVVQLRDDVGTTEAVHVEPDVFDVDSLKAGDQVEVDFKAPPAGSTRLEAAGIWPVAK